MGFLLLYYFLKYENLPGYSDMVIVDNHHTPSYHPIQFTIPTPGLRHLCSPPSVLFQEPIPRKALLMLFTQKGLKHQRSNPGCGMIPCNLTIFIYFVHRCEQWHSRVKFRLSGTQQKEVNYPALIIYLETITMVLFPTREASAAWNKRKEEAAAIVCS